MATIAVPPVDRKASERKFYSRMALFLVPRAARLRPELLSPRHRPVLSAAEPDASAGGHPSRHGLHAVDGAIVAQTQLIAARKHEIHMRLGKLTMLLAILMIPVMYLTAVWQVARANQPPFTDPLTWTIVPLAVIIPFAILVWQGWTHRRNVQTHKRLMLSAAILVVMGPAIGRLPIAPPTLPGFTIQFLLGWRCSSRCSSGTAVRSAMSTPRPSSASQWPRIRRHPAHGILGRPAVGSVAAHLPGVGA